MYAVVRLSFEADVHITSCSVFTFSGPLAGQVKTYLEMCERLQADGPNRVAIVFIGPSYYDGPVQNILEQIGYEDASVPEPELVAT
jgi:hypothetical protein